MAAQSQAHKSNQAQAHPLGHFNVGHGVLLLAVELRNGHHVGMDSSHTPQDIAARILGG
jgi:hypothetical protein